MVCNFLRYTLQLCDGEPFVPEKSHQGEIYNFKYTHINTAKHTKILTLNFTLALAYLITATRPPLRMRHLLLLAQWHGRNQADHKILYII